MQETPGTEACGEAGTGPGAAERELARTRRLAGAISWLLAEGPAMDGIEALFDGFCRHLREVGVALDRSTLHLRLLHPQIRAMTYIWRHGTDGVEAIERHHGIETTPGFRASPIRAIAEEGLEGIRVRLDRVPGPYSYPVLDDLKEQGMTDYVALPMRFSTGRRNVTTLATRADGGFGTCDIALVSEVMPAFAALLEARAFRLLAANLLNTYVGRGAGARILAGDIRRGSGATLEAVLWYCDLRGFTPLSDRLPREQLIALLNGYFEIMGGAVQGRGGEILKFIGDALLAIFPVGETLDGAPGSSLGEACERALAAATDAIEGMRRLNAGRAAWGQPILRAGIALHVGDVMYGNIGAPDRLDFTVIGPAVNLVSRIEGLCKRLDRAVLASDAFAASCGRELVSLGFHPVQGLTRPVEVFGLPGEGPR
ncbi:MAG TPA: adenylate/guanylate cyclase domain-containing protein [Azospirillaceae bacterium]|nr:adenylate/guanylate cyclase domain-containing protein [Azospirillaceae bacterium]